MRDPVAIVRVALGDHPQFKDAIVALSHCEPDADAARMLIDAHDTGEAPSWLVACLLGHVRHRAGYARVIDILRRGDRLLSESYAAEAAVRIAGLEAERDLEDVIDTVDDGSVRKAAAHALGGLGTPSAIAFLSAAPAPGRLRSSTVGQALASTGVEPATMIDAMRSTDRETRRWPAMMIATRLRSPQHHDDELRRCAASIPLQDALAALLEEGEETVWSADAALIRRWLDGLNPSR